MRSGRSGGAGDETVRRVVTATNTERTSLIGAPRLCRARGGPRPESIKRHRVAQPPFAISVDRLCRASSCSSFHPARTCALLCGSRPDREPQHGPTVQHRAREQHRAGVVGVARSGDRWPHRRRVRARHSRLSGCGATISNRSSAATQFGQLLGQPDVSRIISCTGSTPSMRRWNHSFNERKRRPSGTCQSR